MDDQDFAPRVKELLTEWDAVSPPFWQGDEDRCRIVYEIHAETVRRGCKGKFSAILRRMGLRASTAYDMINRHRIKIGEIKDPDADDPRDYEDEEQEEDQKKQNGTQHEHRTRRSKSSTTKVTIELSGKIAEAVAGVRSFYQQTKNAEVVKFCVLRVWSELQALITRQGEQFVTSVDIEGRFKDPVLTGGDSPDSVTEEECLGGPRLIPYVISDMDASEAADVSGTT